IAFTPSFVQDGIHIVYSFVFLLIILNVSSNKNSFLKLENPLLDALGRISYGIYMYHMVVIVFVLNWVKKYFNNANSTQANFYYYSLSIVLTVLISWLSYRYFELFFVKLKRKFTFVLS